MKLVFWFKKHKKTVLRILMYLLALFAFLSAVIFSFFTLAYYKPLFEYSLDKTNYSINKEKIFAESLKEFYQNKIPNADDFISTVVDVNDFQANTTNYIKSLRDSNNYIIDTRTFEDAVENELDKLIAAGEIPSDTDKSVIVKKSADIYKHTIKDSEIVSILKLFTTIKYPVFMAFTMCLLIAGFIAVYIYRNSKYVHRAYKSFAIAGYTTTGLIILAYAGISFMVFIKLKQMEDLITAKLFSNFYLLAAIFVVAFCGIFTGLAIFFTYQFKKRKTKLLRDARNKDIMKKQWVNNPLFRLNCHHLKPSLHKRYKR